MVYQKLVADLGVVIDCVICQDGAEAQYEKKENLTEHMQRSDRLVKCTRYTTETSANLPSFNPDTLQMVNLLSRLTVFIPYARQSA